MILRAQGLLGADGRRGGVSGMLRRLGAVQLDTISVLARSHELVTYARRGPTQRTRIDQAFWGPKSSTFEYWSHAACVLPLEDWPAHAFKRGGAPQEGRHLVGLVREQGRGRMVTRHRAARLPEAPGLSARLRPGRARYSFPPVGPGVVGRGMRRPPRGCRLALAGRGDRGRPVHLPRHAASRGAPRVGVHRVRRGPGGGVEGAGVRPSGGTGRPERPRRDAERPALAVRLADLVPGTPRATVRAAPPSRGVYAEGCASTATSPCRCWAAPASSGWSTPGARTTCCSQSRSPSSIPARPSTRRGACT